MTAQSVSILSTIANLILAVTKIVVGFLINSAALIADGIHSGMDVFSSFVTYFGIKAAKKPVDKEHPYGYYRMESLAGLVVTFLLTITGILILYEGAIRLFKAESVIYSFWAIIVLVGCIIVNETMSRLKFYFGRKYESLSLVADAEHSRADALSSVAVIVGLFLVRYFIYADSIIALLIGAYILRQTFVIGRKITDSLLDVANKDLEKKIKDTCEHFKIKVEEIKTRKIGGVNFAELKIQLDPKLKVEQASSITENLEDNLLNSIPELKYIVISVATHEFKRGTISSYGRRYHWGKGIKPLGPKKLGKRIVIPITEQENISEHFGEAQYLLVDKDKQGNVLQKKTVKNPYFTEEAHHGVKFLRSVSCNKVIAKRIGPGAQRNLEAFGIKLVLTKEDKPEKVI